MLVCNKDFKVLGFLKEFDILTELWQMFFFSFVVCEKNEIIKQKLEKKMGFECAIRPPITTSNCADFYTLESDTLHAKSQGLKCNF